MTFFLMIGEGALSKLFLYLAWNSGNRSEVGIFTHVLLVMCVGIDF